MSCGRHFCPSSDILCSCDLYSTPQPLSLSAPFCPIRFYPLVALAHCPFVSTRADRRTLARTRGNSPDSFKRSLILSWGEWACWGIREGAVGGWKDRGHGRVDDWRERVRMSVTAVKWAPWSWWNTVSQLFHRRYWLPNRPHVQGKCRYLAFREELGRLFTVRRCRRGCPPPVECICFTQHHRIFAAELNGRIQRRWSCITHATFLGFLNWQMAALVSKWMCCTTHLKVMSIISHLFHLTSLFIDAMASFPSSDE